MKGIIRGKTKDPMAKTGPKGWIKPPPGGPNGPACSGPSLGGPERLKDPMAEEGPLLDRPGLKGWKKPPPPNPDNYGPKGWRGPHPEPPPSGPHFPKMPPGGDPIPI